MNIIHLRDLILRYDKLFLKETQTEKKKNNQKMI